MRIAVDSKFFREDKPGYRSFITEVLIQLACKYPAHQFIFLSSTKEPETSADFPRNVIPVAIPSKSSGIFSEKWWYEVKVSKALKKYKADVFVCTNGICSLRTSIPQVLIMHDLTFLRYPAFISGMNLLFLKNFTRSYLKKAKAVVTLSAFIKEEIAATYKIAAEKILAAGSFAGSLFKPLDWEQREEVKEQYSGGCEYFVFTGALQPQKNLWNVLKAFSIFKKWQKTNMKLVITGQIDSGNKEAAEKFNTYKYRSEICFTGELSIQVWPQVLGSAYALVFPSFYEGFALPVAEAMLCEVPVITSANSGISEVAGDAVLFANPADPNEIAEQMKRIFKDEQLRNKLIEDGKQQAKRFNPGNTTSAIWQAIEQAVSR